MYLCRYKRDDELDLTATLYLPPGYDKEQDGRLPCILWAYPREFKTKVGPGSTPSNPTTLHECWLTAGLPACPSLTE